MLGLKGSAIHAQLNETKSYRPVTLVSSAPWLLIPQVPSTLFALQFPSPIIWSFARHQARELVQSGSQNL